MPLSPVETDSFALGADAGGWMVGPYFSREPSHGLRGCWQRATCVFGRAMPYPADGDLNAALVKWLGLGMFFQRGCRLFYVCLLLNGARPGEDSHIRLESTLACINTLLLRCMWLPRCGFPLYYRAWCSLGHAVVLIVRECGLLHPHASCPLYNT